MYRGTTPSFSINLCLPGGIAVDKIKLVLCQDDEVKASKVLDGLPTFPYIWKLTEEEANNFDKGTGQLQARIKFVNGDVVVTSPSNVIIRPVLDDSLSSTWV